MGATVCEKRNLAQRLAFFAIPQCWRHYHLGKIFSDKPPFEKPFVFVDETFGECFKEAEPCPSGLTLTLYVDNGYDPEGESLDHKRYERMHDYAEKKNLIPSADPYCESICRIPRLLNQSYETYTRYCVPVKRS